MLSKKKIEELIVGSHQFLDDEHDFKYRYILIASMLIFSGVLFLVAGVVRFSLGFYFLSSVELMMSIVSYGLYFWLRRDIKVFNTVSTLTMLINFIAFTAIVILLEEEKSKLIWYSQLIISSYLVRGVKFGNMVYIAVSSLFTIMFLTPIVDLHIDNFDFIMTLIAYTCLAIFMNFSEIEKKKDLESIKKQKNMIFEQSRINSLTKLPNMIVLQEDIDNSKVDVSCLVIDIVEYSIIVNRFGESFAKELIIQVEKTLVKLTTQNITLYHLYDKRFAFLIHNSIDNKDILFADELKSTFKELEIEHQEIKISIAFVIAIIRDKVNTLSRASMLLHEMKKSSKTNYEIYQFDAKREYRQKENIYWAKRLSELINDDNIVVYYQPIIDNSSGKIVKYEALVRAVDGEKVVSPYLFLPAAKSKGILKDITKIVIDKSFQTFQNNNYDFSINITGQDLEDDYLEEYLSHKLKQYNIDPNRVILEVLENINSEISANSNDQFKKLKELGINFAIDDFGIEDSNFSRLLTLQADIIKIDGKFIKNLDSDSDSVKIVQTVVFLANKMGAKTVAEFVHSEEIYNIVRELGVDLSQGYYFSAPLPQVKKEEHQEHHTSSLCRV